MRLRAIGLLIACLIGSACTHKAPPTPEEMRAEWSQRIHRVVADPARAERATAIAWQLVAGQQALSRELGSTTERMAALNADHAASKDAYMALYEDFASRQRAAQLQLKDQVLALRREVSADEWKSITR